MLQMIDTAIPGRRRCFTYQYRIDHGNVSNDIDEVRLKIGTFFDRTALCRWIDLDSMH